MCPDHYVLTDIIRLYQLGYSYEEISSIAQVPAINALHMGIVINTWSLDLKYVVSYTFEHGEYVITKEYNLNGRCQRSSERFHHMRPKYVIDVKLTNDGIAREIWGRINPLERDPYKIVQLKVFYCGFSYDNVFYMRQQ